MHVLVLKWNILKNSSSITEVEIQGHPTSISVKIDINEQEKAISFAMAKIKQKNYILLPYL